MVRSVGQRCGRDGGIKEEENAFAPRTFTIIDIPNSTIHINIHHSMINVLVVALLGSTLHAAKGVAAQGLDA